MLEKLEKVYRMIADGDIETAYKVLGSVIEELKNPPVEKKRVKDEKPIV